MSHPVVVSGTDVNRNNSYECVENVLDHNE